MILFLFLFYRLKITLPNNFCLKMMNLMPYHREKTNQIQFFYNKNGTAPILKLASATVQKLRLGVANSSESDVIVA